MNRSFAWRRSVAGLAFASPLVLSGCYSYRTESLASLQAGSATRVVLTPAGSRELAVVLGDSASAVSGRFVESGAAGITLAVTEVERARIPTNWRGERVTIPAAAIDHVGVRQLDGSRSALAAAGVAAAGVIVRVIFLASERSINNTGGGTGGVK